MTICCITGSIDVSLPDPHGPSAPEQGQLPPWKRTMASPVASTSVCSLELLVLVCNPLVVV